MKHKVMMMAMAVLLIASMLIAPMSASAASNSTVQILKVTVDGARLRAAPSGDILTSLKKDSKVFYLNKNKASFCYVCTSKGVRGYIFRDYLASYGAAYADQIYYANTKAKVYKKASTSSSRVGTLSKYQHVIVYEVRGNWAYIKTMGGKGGFVKASALSKAG